MLAVVLALGSALSFGVADYIGGVLSKRCSVWGVASLSQITAGLATGVVAIFVFGDPGAADFVWAVVAGLAGAFGIVFLYRGLSRGRMSVVAPISGIGAAVIPVIVGVAGGERPSVLIWVGIAIAFPAIYLIPQVDPAEEDAANGSPRPGGASDGVLAGIGFGVLFAAIGQMGEGSGFLPLSLMQIVNGAAVAVAAVVLRHEWLPRGREQLPVYAIGLLATAGAVCFLLATHEGLLSVVSVIASLYPAATIAMAAVLLDEHLGRVQIVGLVLATVAVVLVTLG
ncbi:MAG: DMT family transporter [Actinobacteria bacterium]|nr:DMT family transporter [Actinomycetota bacterium]